MHCYPANVSPIRKAWQLSLPVCLVYIPVGAGFGLFCTHSHFAWFWAPLMSLCVYGGSMQFAAISILSNHGSLFDVFIACLSLGARNSFYGLNFLERFSLRWWQKLYFIQSLVDSNFAILNLHRFEDPKQDKRFALCLAVFIQTSWVTGGLLGAILADHIPTLPSVLFILIAFFVVIIVEQYHVIKTLKPYVLASLAMLAAYYFNPSNFLLLAISLSFGVLLLYHAARKQALFKRWLP